MRWWLRAGGVVVVDVDHGGGGMREMVAEVICKSARRDASAEGDGGADDGST